MISLGKSPSLYLVILTLGLLWAGFLAPRSRVDSDRRSARGQNTITSPPSPFLATTVKTFDQSINEAMARMDHGMRFAPMSGVPEHDFVTMMIPHHEGAVDMAKTILLTTKDPELRNLAQGIVIDQQIEIRLMQRWLLSHPAKEFCDNRLTAR